MVEIKKRAVLVTGAARRIGRELALDLAKHGWAVGVHYYHSMDDAESLVTTINRRGGRAVALQANLGHDETVEDLVPEAVRRLGPLTCLINNAGVFEPDAIETLTRSTWDRHLETNVRAPLILSRGFDAHLPAGEPGCIINLLDQRVWNLTPQYLSYTVSKSALWTLTQTLALALAPRIRVNAIGPGPTLRSDRQTPDEFEAMCKTLPLQRRTTPAEICDAVRFILAAPSMTGQMIALDGGEHLGWAQPSGGFTDRR